jgi:DNA-binding protein H-NS
MKTYAHIKAEIAKLERRAEEALKEEVAGVVRRIKDAIAAYGLTAEDLGLSGANPSRGRASKAGSSSTRPSRGVAKYRDPATGKTWTGQGRPPAWIVDAADRDAFRIGSKSNGSATPGTSRNKASRKTRGAPKARVTAKPTRMGNKSRRTRAPSSTAAQPAAVQIESSAAAE